MENKTRSRVMLAITLFSAIVLSGTVFVCARRAGEEVTQRSFDELTTATKQLAKDINNATRTDQTILSAMAELIAGQDEDDLDSVLRIMNTFSLDKTFVSAVALLRPDGTLLLTDGARYDVSGAFDFETEAARGAYISELLCAGKAGGAQRRAGEARRRDHRHPLRRRPPAGAFPKLSDRPLQRQCRPPSCGRQQRRHPAGYLA